MKKSTVSCIHKTLGTAFAVMLALAIPSLAPGQTASLAVGSASGLPGTSVDLNVNFTSGSAGISSLQFDLIFPSSLTYVSTTTGAAANAAGKSATGAAIAGGLRVLVLGLNTNAIGNGSVAAVRLTITAAAPAGNIAVQVANITGAAPDSSAVAVTGTNGSVMVNAPADNTPPTISGVTAAGITQSSATITWATNEAADSQVEYGTTTAYGGTTAIDPAKVTSHTQYLNGLSAGTTYHYRVKSRDAAGNLATSGDFTFVTTVPADTTPPVITGVGASNITSSSAAISWLSDEPADTQVEYGATTSYGSLTGISSTMTAVHAQVLNGLSPATLYHYRVKSRDAAGNLAVSGDFVFTTLEDVDTTPPVITAVAVSNISDSSARVSWTTSEPSDTQVEYGTTSSYGTTTGLQSTLTTSHVQVLSALSAGTVHHYRVRSRDAAGNLAVSGDFTFTTTEKPDTAPPVISGVDASNISNSSASISWTTNEPADTQIEYGTTTGYGSSTTLNPAMVTSHAQALSGLLPDTQYHYRVKSRDAAGNLAISGDFGFTTSAAADTTPPAITGVSATEVGSSTASISWNTNEPADAQVEYGATTAYGASTPLDPALGAAHLLSLAGLSPETTYHYRVKSRDAAGNLGVSNDHTFRTTSESDSKPPVIMSVTAVSTSSRSADISWATNEPADSQVEYGTTAGYGLATTHDSTLVTSHASVLSGLAANTNYHYRVKSRDAAGNLAVSPDFTFTTPEEVDTKPPTITDVQVQPSDTSAIITWTTDEDATTLVEWAATGDNAGKSNESTSRVTSHWYRITGLTPETDYRFRVGSRDAAGNLAYSPDRSFRTAKETTPGGTGASLYLPSMSSAGKSHGEPNAGEDEYTAVALANLDTTATKLTFTAFDSEGNQVAGAGIANPVMRTLAAGEQLPVIDVELFGQEAGPIGWIKVESSARKVAGFFMTFNSDLTVLDGATVSSAQQTSFILPEVDNEGFTRIYLANPNRETAGVAIDLMKFDGTVRGSVSREIKPNGSLSADLYTQLFDGAPVDPSDYLLVTATNGVVPFELLGKERRHVQVLNGQDLGNGSTVLYSPQYVVGGPWRSTISVVNLDSKPGNITMRFMRDDETHLGATKVFKIAANGKVYVSDQAIFQSLFVNPTNILTQGYVEIVSDGVRLSGSVVFGDAEGDRFSSALPLVAKLQESVVFSHVASNDSYFTGLALLNPNDADMAATIELYGADGTLEGRVTETVPGKSRKSRLLTELYPDLAGQNRTSGYVRVMANKPFAGYALFGTTGLSVLSAIPAQPAP